MQLDFNQLLEVQQNRPPYVNEGYYNHYQYI